jgi:hypothetical protein
VDIHSPLEYLHGGTPCANSLSDEMAFEDGSAESTPASVKARSIILAPGTRVSVLQLKATNKVTYQYK